MDIEKAIQFILEHEARHAAAIQKHDEAIAKHDEAFGKLDERLARLEASVSTVTDLVGRLAQAEIRQVERMDGHEIRLQSLETKMTQLFERMDRFIRGLEGNGRKRA